jgi:hypothetical protein
MTNAKITLGLSKSQIKQLQIGLTKGERTKNNKARYLLKKKARAADCHPDRILFAKGLCSKCYREKYRTETAKEFYAKQASKKFRERLYNMPDDEFQAQRKSQDDRCASV